MKIRKYFLAIGSFCIFITPARGSGRYFVYLLVIFYPGSWAWTTDPEQLRPFLPRSGTSGTATSRHACIRCTLAIHTNMHARGTLSFSSRLWEGKDENTKWGPTKLGCPQRLPQSLPRRPRLPWALPASACSSCDGLFPAVPLRQPPALPCRKI